LRWRLHREDAGMIRRGSLAHELPGGAFGSGAGPQLLRVKVVDERGKAADVVVVGVGDDDGVERAHGAVPEVRRDGVRADIEVGRGAAGEGGDGAAVEEEALAVGKDEEETVALADVDGGE